MTRKMTRKMTTKIDYRHDTQSQLNYSKILQELAFLPIIRSIFEINGVANLMISLSFINNNNLEYTIIDISEKELKKSSRRLS